MEIKYVNEAKTLFVVELPSTTRTVKVARKCLDRWESPYFRISLPYQIFIARVTPFSSKGRFYCRCLHLFFRDRPLKRKPIDSDVYGLIFPNLNCGRVCLGNIGKLGWTAEEAVKIAISNFWQSNFTTDFTSTDRFNHWYQNHEKKNYGKGLIRKLKNIIN